MLDGKVIGICTATVSDSEALGLAGPIYQIVRFFRHYANYEESNPLLLTPSWGIDTVPTTRDYLECNGIDPSVQGCRLSKILEVGAVGRASLRERDILMGITTTDDKGRAKRYNIGKSLPEQQGNFSATPLPSKVVFPFDLYDERKTNFIFPFPS